MTELLSRLIAPKIPKEWPLPNPLKSPHLPYPIGDSNKYDTNNRGVFVNGGPICCFQQLEATASGQPAPMYRAMLFYSPNSYEMDDGTGNTGTKLRQSSPPIWCIPESYFPSKKIDTLPPRTAQPILNFSKHYQVVGMNTFDPIYIMKSLHRLEQIVTSNRILTHGNNSKQVQQHNVLQYDVYLCDWLTQTDGGFQQRPKSQRGLEYFPVCIRGAGRPSLSEGEENVLNIGILHIPYNTVTRPRPSTLTLLPPDPHILLPLLIKAAEIENRSLKMGLEKRDKSSMDSGDYQNLVAISKNVILDENWRSEFRAYLFRLPPYYMFTLRRCLRQLIPPRCQSLMSIDSVESVISQCFSRQCLHKIRNGEQVSRESVERLERKEEEYRTNMFDVQDNGLEEIGYGQFDKRSQISNYLNALRQMPPPWKPGSKKRPITDSVENHGQEEGNHKKSVVDR